MPFIPNTPEAHAALLDRSSPPTVCRGVSNDGKACKRTLVRNDTTGQPQSGIITIVNKQQAYFCARHQDQAKDVVLRHTASFARRRALVGRGSMDTLIEQVELLVGDNGGPTMSTTVVSTTRKVPRDKDPFKPALADYEEEVPSGSCSPPNPPSPPGGRRERKRPGFLTRLLMGCCCAVEEDPEDEKNWSERRREAELRSAAAAVVDDNFPKQPIRARKKGGSNAHVSFKSVPPTPPLPMMYPPKKPHSAMVTYGPVPTAAQPSKATVVGLGLSPATPQTIDSDSEEVAPLDPSTLTKQQQGLLKLIPKTIHPKGLGRLQQELLKPFSDKDEPGYIYMFWLTDSPLSPSSSPSSTPSGHTRSSSDRLLRAALAATPTPGGSRPNLLFKIGRAANVQRRLHQWTSQCGYNLSLIRYYPHTSASSSPGAVARQVPNSHRIERLIHLELSATPGANPKRKCAACGKTHKEWFEVEASREGILAVDEVVKRWITFGERSAGKSMSAAPRQRYDHQQQQKRPSPSRKNATGGVKMYEKKPRSVSATTTSTTTGRTSATTKPRSVSAGASVKTKPTTTTTSLPPKQQQRSRNVSTKRRDDDYEDEDSEWSDDDYAP